MLTAQEIIDLYISFFEKRGHKKIPNSPLVPENDPTTLFTSSGMQPLIPYLLGQKHPAGKRLVNSQPSFRAEDIEEVGDNKHTTFFEMLGNWSLGGYFKKEQLSWIWEFLTKELGLPKEKLHVSVFEGNKDVLKDEESYEIWKSLGLPENHIYFYGVDKNWWSRSGSPDKMPSGEIGGPDSEIFYEFIQVKHDTKYGEKCHPNCDCGRFLEIGNSVFIQYQKQEDGSLKELSQKNVDFGGGLERLTAAVMNQPDIFQTDLYRPIIETIEKYTDKKYSDTENQKAMRVIADHMRAAVSLILDGVQPSNKLQGYILRRLIRRTAVKMHELKGGLTPLPGFSAIIESIGRNQRDLVNDVVKNEINKFGDSLDKGLRQVEKIERIDSKKAFDLYQTFGFPYEVTEELFRQKGQEIDREQFKAEFEKHKELSRTASAGMFKGGLGEQSEITIQYHTTTHLLHAALRQILGDHVQQKGSNITSERLRFDFSHPEKLTDEQIKQIEDLVNQKIKENLPVTSVVMDKNSALQNGALGFFTEKYGNKVTVYSIGTFSREICGGPHVDFTSKLKSFKIIKQKNIGHNLQRIYAVLEK